MARKIETMFAIDGETRLKDAIKDINKNYSVMKSELGLVTAQFGKNNNSVDKLTAVNKVLNKQIDIQADKVDELENALKQAEKAYGKGSNEVKDYQIQLNNAKSSLAKLENEVEDNAKAMREQADAASDAGKAVEDYADSADKAAQKSSALKDGVKKVGGVLGAGLGGAVKVAGTAIAGVAAGTAAALGGMVKLGNDYNKMVNQLGASTGASGKNLEELGQVAKKVYGNNFGESLEDVGDAIARINTVTHLSGDALQEAAESGMALRDTFGFEIEESTNAASMLMKQFGISAKEAYDIIAYGAQEGADKNGDMLDTINEYANQYAGLGLSAEQFVTSLEVGVAQGAFSIDKVGDAVKEFGIRSKDGSTASMEAFAAIGLSADEMTKTFAAGGDGAEEALFKVVAALKGVEDPVARNTAGVALFGTQFEDLGEGALTILGSMNDTSGYLEGSLERINEVKYDDLGSAIEGIKRSVETNLLPLASGIAGQVTDIAQGIGSALSDGFQAGDIKSIGSMISTKLVEGIKTISAYLPEIIETVTAVVTEAVDMLVEILPEVLPLLMDGAITLLQGVIDAILANVDQLMDMVTQLILSIVDFFIANLPKILELGIKLLLSLISGIAQALPELIPAIIDAIFIIQDTFIENLPLFIKVAFELIVALAFGLVKAIPKLVSRIPEIFLKMREAFSGFDMSGVGEDMIKGIVDGVLAMGTWLKEKFTGVLSGAVDGVKDFLGIKSPSRKLREEVGLMMGEGVAVGLDDSGREIDDAFKNAIPDLESEYSLAMTTTSSKKVVEHKHSFPDGLVVRGVNDRGELVGVVELIKNELQGELMLQGAF